ncbi:MAG TPA: helix-turn-helix domain-containing protein [Firmicutes bacterium]|nr:helix-turn-helix domain-containing protein [Bacillota bacterium]
MRSRKGRNSERVALIQARRRAGLSQQQVAEAVGVSRSFYTLIERGCRTPSLAVALRIAEFFGAAPGELFSPYPWGTSGRGRALSLRAKEGEGEA